MINAITNLLEENGTFGKGMSSILMVNDIILSVNGVKVDNNRTTMSTSMADTWGWKSYYNYIYHTFFNIC